MQQSKPVIPNRARSEATRTKLIGAARSLFVQKGYSDTSTPEIVASAGVTRGALYHHFAHKRDLFRAVVEIEAAAVAEQIDRQTSESSSALGALLSGSEAYFAAMSKSGRTRLLLVDAPAVLGTATMDDIDQRTGRSTLRKGLAFGMERGEMDGKTLDATAAILSAAFDKAALDIASGKPATAYKAAIRRILEGFFKRG